MLSDGYLHSKAKLFYLEKNNYCINSFTIISNAVEVISSITMEETTGSQYALHIALQTLKERCQNLQQRLILLEEENTSLRVKCNDCVSNSSSLTEVDALKARITHLREQKAKLKSNLAMVANENRHLWSQLSSLSQVNKSIGSHLTKINESLKQHTKTNQTATYSALVYSPPEQSAKQNLNGAITESDRISLELEDISLKLISNIAKEKSELEAQCTEMAEMQNAVVTNSFNFSYLSEDVNDSLAEEFSQHLIHLKNIKDELLQQKGKLQENISKMRVATNGVSCTKCVTREKEEVKKAIENLQLLRSEDIEEEQQLESLAKWGTPENSDAFLHDTTLRGNMNICPMCSQVFHFTADIDMNQFFQHVESHFTANENIGSQNL